MGVRGGRSGGFGLQHNDFARRCQRFTAIPRGMPQAVTALFCCAYWRLRSGNLSALALWSAKSKGTENCPVFVSKTQRQPESRSSRIGTRDRIRPFSFEYCSTRTWPWGEVNVSSASGSRSNSLPGLSAPAGITVTSANNERIAIPPNQPPDTSVSRCKFWPLDWGAGHEVQHSASATKRNGQGELVSP